MGTKSFARSVEERALGLISDLVQRVMAWVRGAPSGEHPAEAAADAYVPAPAGAEPAKAPPVITASFPGGGAIPAAPAFFPRLLRDVDRSTFQAVSDAANEIPAFPAVTSQLIATLSRPDCSHEEVARLAELDAALAAALLRIANSMASSPVEEVTRVDTAVLRVGFDIVHAVALRTSISSMLQMQRAVPGSYDVNALWTHSVAVSIYAGVLARRVPRMDPSEAMTAGLLHDVGKIIINMAYGERVCDLLNPNSSHLGESLLGKEQRLFGACHTAFGAAVARRWGLPEALALAIERHHHGILVDGGSMTERERHLIAITFVANQLAKLSGYCGADREIDLPSPELMQSIDLSPDLEQTHRFMPDRILETIQSVTGAKPVLKPAQTSA